jgi:hypothetical protein
MSKKLLVPKEQLPDPNIYDPKYPIRFRLISEDRNSLSAWSPIYNVDPEVFFERGTFEIPGYIRMEKNGSTSVGVTWDSVSIYKTIDSVNTVLGLLPYYDLWIRWAGVGGATPSNWFYKERIASTSVNLVVPATYPYTNPSTGVITNVIPKYLYVEIYRPGRPITRYQQTASFPQNAATVDIANNMFIFPEGHGSSTGTPGLYTSTTPVGGMTSGVTYYTRTINYYKIAIYPTRNDALLDTNRINLTGSPSGTGSFTGYPFLMYDSVITNL